VVEFVMELDKRVLGTLVGLTTIIGTAFAVDGMYMRRAEAKEQLEKNTAAVLRLERELSVENERGRLEGELQVIRLELEFLATQYQDVTLNDGAKEKLRDRKQYLRKREEIIETRLLALGDKQ
jgi:hypothetical protein